jgi:hypothetical protein
MSGFSYVHISCSNRGSFIAFAAKAQLIIERWNASHTHDLKAFFQTVDDGVIVELVEGRQSLWYSLSRKPEPEKVAKLVELLNHLSCLEAPQSFNLGIAKDNENEFTASRDLIEMEEPSDLFDLDKKRWKKNSRFHFPKVHLYQFTGVNVKLGRSIVGPDGQDIIGFYTDYFVVAKDPNAAWERLTEHLGEQVDTCDEVGETLQIEFPEAFDGEMMWYGNRVFYSNETT